MVKKVFSTVILALFATLPVFGIKVTVPQGHAGDDLPKKHVVDTQEEGIFQGINIINKYLRWSFAVICTAVVVYGGYQLITANGDKKAMKKAVWALMGAGIGITIAMLSYTIVSLLTNL
ncbi:hypothetical protein BSK20_04740 [SR1 bacterium human oral taxon HOT-345]|nr:hypothetical protein BSK20_04740 [SR1 bacterium human oral taxon HOT-345]